MTAARAIRRQTLHQIDRRHDGRVRPRSRALEQLRRGKWIGHTDAVRRAHARERAGTAGGNGFFAWQTRRPWKITRCESIVHSRFSIIGADDVLDLDPDPLPRSRPSDEPARSRSRSSSSTGVARDAGQTRCRAPHLRSCRADTGSQRDQDRCQLAEHDAAIAADQRLPQPDQRRCLVPEEAGRLDASVPSPARSARAYSGTQSDNARTPSVSTLIPRVLVRCIGRTGWSRRSTPAES